MRLPRPSSYSISLAQIQVWQHTAWWYARRGWQRLVLERWLLVLGNVLFAVLAVGAALLLWALWSPSPGGTEPPAADQVLATDVVDRLNMWLDEQSGAKTEPVTGLTPNLFVRPGEHN